MKGKREVLKEELIDFNNSNKTHDDYMKLFIAVSKATKQGSGLVWSEIDKLVNECLKTTKLSKATFVSVWDDGVNISSSCDINMETGEVFNIEQVDVGGLDILIEEYVELSDGRLLDSDHFIIG